MKHTTFVQLTRRELDTVLAALRTYVNLGYGDPGLRPLDIHDIAAEHDTSLGAEEIDTLCEELNESLPIEWAHECPRCDCDTVEGGAVEIEDDMTTQRCWCPECGAEWILGFGLVSVSILP